MPPANARLTMRLSPVTSNVEPERYMSLVVEDITSGRQIASFELLGEHLMDLLGGRQVGSASGVPAWLIEPEDRHALGRHSFTTTRHFGASKHSQDAVRQWATRNVRAHGAHTFRLSRNNNHQHVISFVHYVDGDYTETVVSELAAIKQADLDGLPCPPAGL